MAAKRKPAVEGCHVDGCTRPAHKKTSICVEHAAQNYVLACTVDGCDLDVFAKGRCKAHYMRLYRKKQGKSAPSASVPVRAYGQDRFEVFTRIPADAARVIIKASGRAKGMYEKAAEILVEWAERNAA